MTQKLKFVRDFRSAATSEEFYGAGSIGEFTDDQAKTLQAEGAAVPAPMLAAVSGPNDQADWSQSEWKARHESALRESQQRRDLARWNGRR
jgi:hypothetical protein